MVVLVPSRIHEPGYVGLPEEKRREVDQETSENPAEIIGLKSHSARINEIFEDNNPDSLGKHLEV